MPRKPFKPYPTLFDEVEQPIELIPRERMQEIATLHRPAAAISAMQPLEANPALFFMSLGSGSSGNCFYIGDRSSGLLIDAGIKADDVLLALKRNGISTQQIKGILLTHDHHDHISQAYAILRANRHMRLYCTPRTFNGVLRRHNISRRIKDYHQAIYKEIPIQIGSLMVTAFEVSHDSTDCVGFHIATPHHTFAIATDLGTITPRADHYMRQAQTIVIEANYDREMLVNGAYPEYLKARILSARGHLDNADTAEFLASALTPEVNRVFLCHLSHENNTPERAVATVTSRLYPSIGTPTPDSGISIPQNISPSLEIIPLPRFTPTMLYTL